MRWRTGRTGAGGEPELAGSSRVVQASKKNRPFQNDICANGTTGKLSLSKRGGKALKEERLPSAMTWSDLVAPGEDDLGWLQKAPAARPHHPAGSERGTGSRTLHLLRCRSKPIRQNPFSPPTVQNTHWNGWRLSDVHILVTKLLFGPDER